MEPTEFPSEEDRRELRSEWVYPLSQFVIRAGGFCGVWVGVLLMRGEWGNLLDTTRAMWGGSGGFSFREIAQPLNIILNSLARIVGSAACAGLVGATLFGLLQTRGEFRPRRLGFVMDRVNPFRSIGIVKVLLRVISSVVMYLVLPLCAWFLVQGELPRVVSALTLDRTMSLRWATDFLPSVVLYACFGVVALAAVIGVFTFLRFLFEHKVVRKDVV